MAVNKVIYNDQTLIDLTNDTVVAEKLVKGYTAHDKAGNPITGTLEEVGMVTKTAVLESSGWIGSTSPYVYYLNYPEVNSSSLQIITPPIDISNSDLEMLQAANLQDGGQNDSGDIIIKAYGDKPTADLQVRVMIINV